MVHAEESDLALMLEQQTLDPLSHPQSYSGTFLRQYEKDAMLHMNTVIFGSEHHSKGNIGPRADRQLWVDGPAQVFFV